MHAWRSKVLVAKATFDHRAQTRGRGRGRGRGKGGRGRKGERGGETL